jgi:hypothetical protein
MASASQTVGEFTITGSNSTAGGPVTFTISSSIGNISGLSVNDIQNATYALDPNDPAYTFITFGGRKARTSNAKAASLKSGASSAVSSITQQLTAAPATPPTNTATVNPAPAAATGTAAPAGNSTNTLTGSANGDSGAPQASAPGTTPKSPAGPAGAGGTTASTATNNASTPPPSKPQSSANSTLPPVPTGYQFEASRVSTQQVAPVSVPGKRLKNPLGEFPTYTDQISLYMITPDAYEAFVASGRTKIDAFNGLTEGTGAGGAFLVAQSGGINNTNSKRMPGFEYDYGIDNLEITQAINGKATQDANVISAYNINFQITEPYGFSFIQKLKEANDIIASYSGGASKAPESGSRQFFILGVRFFGYNVAGVPAKPSDTMSYNGIGSGEPNKIGSIDPLSQNGAIFEHFYDITIKSLKFKLDGKMTVYNIEATNAGTQAGFSVKRGTIKENTPLTASTAAEMLDKLAVKLNKDQQLLADQKKIEFPNKYEIVWMPGTQPIIDASMISEADKDKSKSPGSGATSTQGVTASTEIQNQAASTGVAQTVTFGQGTNIMAAITQVISQSSYINDALKVIYSTKLESPDATKAPPEVSNAQAKRISWFSCSTQIKSIKWDSIVNDWAYEMQYLINKYETPVVDSAYAYGKNYYPGAHKRYDYWYTGKNSEILHYEQTFDNLFFNVAVNPSEAAPKSTETGSGGEPATSGPTTPNTTALVPGMFTSQPRIGKTGYGMEATNNYITSLYDPGAYAEVHMTILGDPDYLIQEPAFSEQVVYDKVYGPNGFNINPGGGQVFIEVDFKEAVDYTSQTGTLSINDSIRFQKLPDDISKKIKGISYMVTEVISKFRGGAFTQDLKMVNPPFAGGESANPAAADSGRPPETATANGANNGSPPGNTTQSSGSAGTKADPKFNSTNPTTTPTNTNNQTPAAGTTPTGPNKTPVANDDSSSTIARSTSTSTVTVNGRTTSTTTNTVTQNGTTTTQTVTRGG